MNFGEKVLADHWTILLQDPFLKPFIPDRPQVTYRRAPNLKTKIAPSKIRSRRTVLDKPILLPLIGMFQCRKTCQYIQHGKKSFTTKGVTHTLKDFYNCSSDFVVYGLTCPCGLLYVGHTIQALRTRFGEHRRSIESDIDPLKDGPQCA